MQSNSANTVTQMRVGFFAFLIIVMLVVISIYVNDKPFWWRPCQLVNISIEDATGLRTKSPVKSLGLEIGYLKSVELSEAAVRLSICVTAPVEVISTTRAYIRAEGFLGDKFVELKPVKALRDGILPKSRLDPNDVKSVPSIEPQKEHKTGLNLRSVSKILAGVFFESQAWAAEEGTEVQAASKSGAREIPVGNKKQDVEHLVNEVDGLVTEMKSLTGNLKEALNPQQLKTTVDKLNQALENASKTLSPEGGLNTSAQRTLAKLEDAIEQLRDLITRVNRGEGSVGMILNDPTYAEDIRKAIQNINRLLNKAGQVRVSVDLYGAVLTGHQGTRGSIELSLWPDQSRYYRAGLTSDIRGTRKETHTTTEVNGTLISDEKKVEVVSGDIAYTLMIGKVFLHRYDFSVGIKHSEGAARAALLFGPLGEEHIFQFAVEPYGRSGVGLDSRVELKAFPLAKVSPFSSLYLMAGLEGFRSVKGRLNAQVGAGLTFDDDDIKLLLTFK